MPTHNAGVTNMFQYEIDLIYINLFVTHQK